MSTARNPDFSTILNDACERVTVKAREKHDAYEEAVSKALRTGKPTPERDVPDAASAEWVRWAAKILDEGGVPTWIRAGDLAEAFEDLVSPLLRRLRDLPEFRTWSAEIVDIRWTRKPIVVRDVGLEDPTPGRAMVVPEADRETWTGEGPAPAFRLELSLPWWLLATEHQQEHGLHSLLAAFGWDGKPVIRKPDIHAHASTLARYGIANARQASAVAHAQAHPSHVRALRSFGFDPDTGQGILCREPITERQQNLVDQALTARKRRGGTMTVEIKGPPLGLVESLPDDPGADTNSDPTEN